jgi:putative FmdB family regulatory protein
MPLYAYKCDACGHEFDKFQHFVDDPLTVCPVCMEETLRKVFSPVGIVFKGKGFYATDHRSPSGTSSSNSSKSNSNSSSNASSDPAPVSSGTSSENSSAKPD